MTKFIMSAAASALVLASATASFAGNPVAATDEAEPDVFAAAGSSVSAPVILGAVAAVALLGALSSDDDAATTTTGATD